MAIVTTAAAAVVAVVTTAAVCVHGSDLLLVIPPRRCVWSEIGREARTSIDTKLYPNYRTREYSRDDWPVWGPLLHSVLCTVQILQFIPGAIASTPLAKKRIRHRARHRCDLPHVLGLRARREVERFEAPGRSRERPWPQLASHLLSFPLSSSPLLSFPRLASPTWPRLASPHLTSPHLTSPHLSCIGWFDACQCVYVCAYTLHCATAGPRARWHAECARPATRRAYTHAPLPHSYGLTEGGGLVLECAGRLLCCPTSIVSASASAPPAPPRGSSPMEPPWAMGWD